jgi:LL-diaminopimelate aminotransferase
MSVERARLRPAERMSGLQPQLFAELTRQKRAALREAGDLIDLGVADPDLPMPAHVQEVLSRESHEARHHRYPDGRGLPEFRQEIARWYQQHHGVRLDAETQVLALQGAKEGVAHLPLAFLDPGAVALVPDPGYPAYTAGVLLAGGLPYPVPLRKEHAFLPDLAAIPGDVLRRARLLFLNFPNNPTAACAPREFLAEAVAFAARHGLLVCNDFVYSEMWFEGERPPSILEVEGAQEVAVECVSFSKTYSMAGLRLGAVVGNPDVIAALARLKENIDSGVFNAIQLAGVAALRSPPEVVNAMRATYRARRDVVFEALRCKGLPFIHSRATPFVWAPVPRALDSVEWSLHVLREARVVVTPGVGFGASGEGYYRISLTTEADRLEEAMHRLVRAAG